LHQLDADTGFVRRTRTGRQDDTVRLEGKGLCDGEFIIADDLCVGANFFQIVDEVPGEAVIIVDDEDLFSISHG